MGRQLPLSAHTVGMEVRTWRQRPDEGPAHSAAKNALTCPPLAVALEGLTLGPGWKRELSCRRGPWVWPGTKNPSSTRFVSGWGAEGLAVRKPGVGPMACLAPEWHQPDPEGCGPVGLGRQVPEQPGAGGGILGVMERSRVIPKVCGQGPSILIYPKSRFGGGRSGHLPEGSRG